MLNVISIGKKSGVCFSLQIFLESGFFHQEFFPSFRLLIVQFTGQVTSAPANRHRLVFIDTQILSNVFPAHLEVQKNKRRSQHIDARHQYE